MNVVYLETLLIERIERNELYEHGLRSRNGGFATLEDVEVDFEANSITGKLTVGVQAGGSDDYATTTPYSTKVSDILTLAELKQWIIEQFGEIQTIIESIANLYGGGLDVKHINSLVDHICQVIQFP